MIINSHSENFLCFVLAYHILIKKIFDSVRGRELNRLFAFFDSTIFLNNFITELDTFIANIDAGTRYEFLNFVLAFCAKRAVKNYVVVFFGHQPTSSHKYIRPCEKQNRSQNIYYPSESV